jgi:hypothetical protein
MRDQAWRIAANVAKLLDLPRKQVGCRISGRLSCLSKLLP